MSQRTLDKLSEWAVWYAENKDRCEGDKKIDFLERAIDELGGVLTDFLGDIMELEGRPRETLGRKLLWTPSGITQNGATRFG